MLSPLVLVAAGVSATLGPEPVWLGRAPVEVHRVVSLAPALTELVFALGAGPLLVGVTRFDDYPPEVRALAKVGGFVDPDPEAVLALRPDLVLAIPTSGGRGRVDTLARLGLPILVVPGESIDDLWTAIAAVGAALDRRAAAEQLAGSMRAELERLRRAHAGRPPRRALVVVGHRPLVVCGPQSFFAPLLGHLGLTNAVAAGGAYPTLDVEAVITLDPEVIIDLTRAGHEAGEQLWQRLAPVDAVRRGRLFVLDDPALLRPGPRLPAALAALARRLGEAP